ncbi:MAG TPA: nuclease-related domain-containing protein [Methylomirabilota bacterium]|nr:nuclease-related domain-containing protein [Methylomirabilota bacterium]
MAKVLGESGRYASQEEIKKFRQLYLVVILVMCVLGTIQGFVLSISFIVQKRHLFESTLIELILLGLICLVGRIGFRELNKIEKERMAMRKGATGENVVAQILKDFPESFCVINGLTTPFGDLDHVVIGPTGVYVLDTKNWKGVVSADGKGELLLNGKPTDKPTSKPFVIRMMNVKEKIKTLCNLDPFFKAVLVFPIARIDARWGETGSANCIREDQLWDYIVENEITTKLDKAAVEKLSQAFLALATMDKEFQPSAIKSNAPRPAP